MVGRDFCCVPPGSTGAGGYRAVLCADRMVSSSGGFEGATEYCLQLSGHVIRYQGSWQSTEPPRADGLIELHVKLIGTVSDQLSENLAHLESQLDFLKAF